MAAERTTRRVNRRDFIKYSSIAAAGLYLGARSEAARAMGGGGGGCDHGQPGGGLPRWAGDALAARVGEEEAMRMIWDRPYAILADFAPDDFVSAPPARSNVEIEEGRVSFWRSLVSWGGR